ncbi:hypothetical protein [Aerosakkonema funiforme]|uniref:hypothetical protein n=1 Tax=Aerosakkonema funiforme TaxID=1246630 RepID=UPI0035B81D20
MRSIIAFGMDVGAIVLLGFESAIAFGMDVGANASACALAQSYLFNWRVRSYLGMDVGANASACALAQSCLWDLRVRSC